MVTKLEHLKKTLHRHPDWIMADWARYLEVTLPYVWQVNRDHNLGIPKVTTKNWLLRRLAGREAARSLRKVGLSKKDSPVLFELYRRRALAALEEKHGKS